MEYAYKIRYNKVFARLLAEFKLPDNFSFAVEYPEDILAYLNKPIVLTEYGISLAPNKLYKPKEPWENASVIEDYENHFHVDCYISPPDNKKTFMLGIKTLFALADKFQAEGCQKMRFWYFFQTPELSQLQ